MNSDLDIKKDLSERKVGSDETIEKALEVEKRKRERGDAYNDFIKSAVLIVNPTEEQWAAIMACHDLAGENGHNILIMGTPNGKPFMYRSFTFPDEGGIVFESNPASEYRMKSGE